MQKIIQDMSIGQNILRLRKERGFKQVQLAALMHTYGSSVSDTTLAKIEGGYRNIRASDLAILQIIFDVSYDEFFKGFSVSVD